MSILRPAFLFLIGLAIAAKPACAQTWTSHFVSPNGLESLTCLASSADGSTLVVGSGSADNSGGSLGQILISTDSGLSWQTTSAPSNWWTAVACSGDGTKIVAVNLGYDNPIYTSSDSGNTWIPQSSPITYGAYGAASSADGTKLVVFGTYGTFPIQTGLFLSSDSGATWTLANAGNTNNTSLGWGAVASSADGTHLAATSGGTGPTNYIYVSSDSGNTWVPANVFSEGWSAIASSADGSKIVALGNGGIYTSDDYGATWQVQPGPPPAYWSAVASSADGNRLLIGTQESNVPLYSSFDGGLTWVSNNVPGIGCQAVASSADGVKLAALPLNIGDVIGTVQLADIDVSILATPSHVDLHDMIQVTLTITNESTNTVSNVQLNGALTASGSGGVSFSDVSGPAIIESLPPGTNAILTYTYEATGYGFVTFSASVTGQELSNTIFSLPAYSGKVAIFPTCDLMVKTAATNNTTFLGVDEFQQTPTGDQSLRMSVDSSGIASYIVRVQNDSSYAHAYWLTGNTNSAYPNWNLQVLYDNANILGALTTPGGGWMTPTLDAGDSIDLQVSLSPLAGAGLLDNPSVLISAQPDATNDYILDSVILHAQLVPVAVQIALLSLDSSGYSSDSIQAGMDDINAPLVPVTDPNVLAAEQQINGGLVADGVTPLVIQVTADPVALMQFPQGLNFGIQVNTLGLGALNDPPLNQRFQVLQNGAWQPLTADTPFTLTSSANVGYLELTPIVSDDLLFNTVANQLGVDFSVVDNATSLQCGDQQFNVRKPPIALIHGYNTSGQWGEGFKSILDLSRPYTSDAANNFIVTVTYGQDVQPGSLPTVQAYAGIPVYENTVASLDYCAQMALGAFTVAMRPLHYQWAFTRFDVVAHSQGGLLTRMLCNAAGNTYVQQPFRNPGNFYRGRFNRIITIGSPHNGARLLRYLLDLNQLGMNSGTINFARTVAFLGVTSAIAQEKFDPFGPQIAELNNPSPSGIWQPDPGASFHLVRAVIDGGNSPKQGDTTPSYNYIGLATAAGGAAVIPSGSDGVVDFDSMGANVPPAPVGANVYTIPVANSISHSQPLGIFASDSCETESPVAASHVIDALDQVSSVPASDIVFGSFSVPPLLSSSVQTAIDGYASTVIFKPSNASIGQYSKQDDQTNYRFELTFPTNAPPEGNVAWYVQVYGPDGITSDGVELSEGGPSNSQVTLTVDGSLVGDVVLSAAYLSVSNTIMVVPPVLVVSLPASGPAMNGFQIFPGSIALSVGSVITPEFLASYSDGSTSFRYPNPSAIEVTSSQPDVVSVTNSLAWQLASIGTSTVTVNWNGFQEQDQITVFDPDSTNPPPLTLVNSGGGQLTAFWVGFNTSWQLESSDDLSSANWTPVQTIPVMAGGESYVTLSTTDSQQFYRLLLRQ